MAAEDDGCCLRILCLHGFRQSGRSLEGRTHALRRRLRGLAQLEFMDAPHELPALFARARLPGSYTPAADGSGTMRPRRAWLLLPEQHEALQQPCQAGMPAPAPAPAFVDDGQHARQTAGWQASWATLRAALERRGPFDGLLGLSQGAAVAAAAAALQEREFGARRPWFRFVILVAGFPCPAHEPATLLGAAAAAGGLALPSLHLWASDPGADRQVGPGESDALARCFDPGQRSVVRHAGGHLIPTTRPVMDQLREFLRRMPQRCARPCPGHDAAVGPARVAGHDEAAGCAALACFTGATTAHQ